MPWIRAWLKAGADLDQSSERFLLDSLAVSTSGDAGDVAEFFIRRGCSRSKAHESNLRNLKASNDSVHGVSGFQEVVVVALQKTPTEEHARLLWENAWKIAAANLFSALGF